MQRLVGHPILNHICKLKIIRSRDKANRNADLIPVLPPFLASFTPHLKYHLIAESAYSDTELASLNIDDSLGVALMS